MSLEAVPPYTARVTERDIIDGWVPVLADVRTLAEYIAGTEFVPKVLRNKPDAIAACILTGRELGIGPMQALKSIHMVQGVPSLSAEYKRARALAAGHEIVLDETNATRCVIRGRRAGSDRWLTITWTLDMARRAKIAGKDVWQQYPQRMLQARASGELCDLLFPDASLGLETTEVLQDGGVIVVGDEPAPEAAVAAAEQPGNLTALPAGKPRTAQRAKRRQATPQPPEDDSPSASPPPATRQAPAADGDPPLPGEEETAAAAPQPDAAAAPDDDESKAVTPAQLRAIWTILSKVFHFGNDDRDTAREVCAHIVSRKLASSRDLTRDEARAVLDTLAHWQAQAKDHGEDARAWMLTVMHPDDGGGEPAGGQ